MSSGFFAQGFFPESGGGGGVIIRRSYDMPYLVEIEQDSVLDVYIENLIDSFDVEICGESS